MTAPDRNDQVTARADRPVLVVRHVPWEGPHRILAAFGDRPIDVVDAFAPGGTLPDPGDVAGAIFMGGPMSVNHTERFPALGREIAWIGDAHERGVPMLGVCLGSQLIARALGASVRPAAAVELGWGAIDVLDPSDPLFGHLAPTSTVLHWHGEVFDLPPGAEPLARSSATPCQAFRAGRSWGVLFHAEADAELVDLWLEEPVMREEAEAALGSDAAALLRADAARHAPALTPASDAMFGVFAEQLELGDSAR